MVPGIYCPYRPDSPERVRNKEASQKYFEYLGYSVSYVDSDLQKPFSRGEARNRAIMAAIDSHSNPAVIVDVDCLPEPEALHRALAGCDSYGGLHFPFTHVRVNSPVGNPNVEHGHDGGCIVVVPEEYRAISGSPEFYRWGWEDKILLARYRTWLGPEVRHQGILNHLWHPPSTDRVRDADYHWALGVCKLYEAAIGSVWDLLDLEGSTYLWEDPANTLGARRSRPGW